MFDELNQAIGEYRLKWQTMVKERINGNFFADLLPTSVGWKAEDLADFDRRFAVLRGACEQVHLVWLNGRWIATIVLKSEKLEWEIGIIKLMQRRPGSTDAIGLDHIDFYSPTPPNANALLAQEPDLNFTDEANGLCKWTSLWFGGTEAKFRHETTLDVCIAELREARERIIPS